MKDVEDAFAMAPTSSKSHKDKITNYEEVKKTLVEAGMQDLLPPSKFEAPRDEYFKRNNPQSLQTYKIHTLSASHCSER